MFASTWQSSVFETFIYRLKRSLQREIFNYLSPHELNVLARCSKRLANEVNGYSMFAWNLEDFVQQWFHHTEELRATMAYTGAVISGSQIIQFFDRCRPIASSDLDILTRIGGIPALICFLESEGYSQVPRPKTEQQYDALTDCLTVSSSDAFVLNRGGRHGILFVADFARTTRPPLRPGHQEEETIKVQLIAVAQNPIEHLIYTYHSSMCITQNLQTTIGREQKVTLFSVAGVMNFMTHQEAISLFPKATFIDRTFYPCDGESLEHGWNPPWKTKYERRGFRIDARSRMPAIRLHPRFVKDYLSWCIEFKGMYIRLDQKYPAHLRKRADTPSIVLKAIRNALYITGDIEDTQFEMVWMREPLTTKSVRKGYLAINEPEVGYYTAY